MNTVLPQYAPIDFATFAADERAELPSDRAIRLHVTRETEYGDRFKLFVVPPTATEPGSKMTLRTLTGLDLDLEPDNRFYVANTQFNGPAEKAGVTFGDYLTAIDIEQLGRPAKEWIYLLGFLLLGLVFGFQSIKARKMKIGDGGAAVEGTI